MLSVLTLTPAQPRVERAVAIELSFGIVFLDICATVEYGVVFARDISLLAGPSSPETRRELFRVSIPPGRRTWAPPQ